MSQHTDREYEAELTRLRERILLMGAKVEEVIGGALRSVVERDPERAKALIAGDREIDALEVENDELCLRILARRQPVASDLRFLTIALKIVTDLERMGDLAVNISERSVELAEEPPLKPYVDLPKMGEDVRRMLRDALDAFVARDADRAAEVIRRDSGIDAYYAQIFRELLTYMMEDPRNITACTHLLFCAKNLERIGDHVTNIAENAYYVMTGTQLPANRPKVDEPAAMSAA